MTAPQTPARSWRVRIPFAGEWLTANPRGTGDRYGRARTIRAWREASAVSCLVAKLPKGLTPVKLHLKLYYAARPPVRDADNIAPTVKAIVDGLGPAREFARKGKRYRSPGYGLVPDDSDRHVHAITKELLPSPTGQAFVELTITEVQG